MKNTNKTSTTVKVDSELYDELKILSVRHKYTLQSFVEKCIYFYVHNQSVRETLNGFQIPVLNSTGSL
jgi:predicted transcriptional regulator